MLTLSTLLALAGGVFRCGLTYLLWRRYHRVVTVPPVVAALIVVLSLLPDWMRPVPWPLPLSITVGLLLPDLLLRGCRYGR
jgi:hypothetical protein